MSAGSLDSVPAEHPMCSFLLLFSATITWITAVEYAGSLNRNAEAHKIYNMVYYPVPMQL